MAKEKVDQPTKEEQETKTKLLQEIHHELELDVQYLIMLVTSTIVATLGLLLNNVAIIIGAMLITPLFWPILGVAMGIITHRRGILRKSLLSLGASILLVVGISYLVSLITPIVKLPEEVLIRAKPTVLDLIIALSISIVGVSALRYKKISASSTGVAISLSLLPALSVVGVGLAANQQEIAVGAGLLFAANAVAIIFAGAITLLILGVKPEYKEEKRRLQLGLVISLLMIIALAIPLSLFLQNTIEVSRQSLTAERAFKSELSELIPGARTNGFEVTVGDDLVEVETTVFLPEGTRLNPTQRTALMERVSTGVDRKVDLHLNLVSSLEVFNEERQQQEQEPELDPGILEGFVLTEKAETYLAQEWSGVTLINVLPLAEENELRMVVAVPEDFEDAERLASESAQAMGYEPDSPDFEMLVIPYQN